MKITIEIPKEFEKDFIDDKFNDFFERISADLEYVVCGRYEIETLKMMHHAFYDVQDVPDINVGDCISRKKLIKKLKCRRWKMASDTTPMQALEVKFGNEMLDMILDTINNQPQVQPIVNDKTKLKEKLIEYFNIGDSSAYYLTRVKGAFNIGTMTLDDFVEFTENDIDDLVDYLTKKEV